MGRIQELENLLWHSCDICVHPEKITLVAADGESITISVPKLSFTENLTIFWYESSQAYGLINGEGEFTIKIDELQSNSEILVFARYTCEDKISKWSTMHKFTTGDDFQPVCGNVCNIHSISSVLEPLWQKCLQGEGEVEMTWSMRPEGYAMVPAPNPDFNANEPVGPDNPEYIAVPSPGWDGIHITEEQFKAELVEVFSQYSALFNDLFNVTVNFTYIDDFSEAEWRFVSNNSLTPNNTTLAVAGPVTQISNGVTDKYLRVAFYINHTWEPDCGNLGGFSVQYVGAHEMAHILGLAHGTCHLNGTTYAIMNASASAANDLCDNPYGGQLANDLYIRDCIYSVFSNPDLILI